MTENKTTLVHLTSSSRRPAAEGRPPHDAGCDIAVMSVRMPGDRILLPLVRAGPLVAATVPLRRWRDRSRA